MGLASHNREMPTATYTELETSRAKAREFSYPSLGTATLIAWD